MKLYFDSNDVTATACKMPKMGGRGRTWDVFKSIQIDGVKHDVWADTTWGKYGYFMYRNQWYKVPIWVVDEYGVFLTDECKERIWFKNPSTNILEERMKFK